MLCTCMIDALLPVLVNLQSVYSFKLLNFLSCVSSVTCEWVCVMFYTEDKLENVYDNVYINAMVKWSLH